MVDFTGKQLTSVPCPTCGAAKGARCLLHSGAPRAEPHVDRKLLAAETVEAQRHSRPKASSKIVQREHGVILLLLPATLSMALLGAVSAAAATPEACALVPQDKVAKIIGNDAPIFTQQPTTDRNGSKISTCVYQQPSGTGNTAFLSVTTLDTAAAAQEQLQAYGKSLVNAGGKVEPDKVSGIPARFITSKGGTRQMFVVKGKILLGAGVGARRDGKATPLRDPARALLEAALSAL